METSTERTLANGVVQLDQFIERRALKLEKEKKLEAASKMWSRLYERKSRQGCSRAMLGALYYRLARLSFSRGQYQECSQQLRLASRCGYETAQTLELAGCSWEHQKNLEQAQFYYREAIRRSPQNERLWRRYASSFLNLNKLESAQLCYEKAIFLNSKNESAYLGLFHIYLRKRDWTSIRELLFRWKEAVGHSATRRHAAKRAQDVYEISLEGSVLSLLREYLGHADKVVFLKEYRDIVNVWRRLCAADPKLRQEKFNLRSVRVWAAALAYRLRCFDLNFRPNLSRRFHVDERELEAAGRLLRAEESAAIHRRRI